MHLDEESARWVLGRLDGEPDTPSGVDVHRAVTDGRRRRRARRVGGYAATAVVTVLVLVGGAGAADGWLGPQASPATSQAPGSPDPTEPAVAPPPQAPTKCQISELLLPDGREMALVTGADPTGRFLLGRTYPDSDPGRSGEYHVVVWDGRKPTLVLMKGMEQALNDVNTKGLAVGGSYSRTSTTAWLYRNGTLSMLPGGDGAEAHAINDANVAVGVRNSKPVIWPSVDRVPVELPLPAGANFGYASDIDEDGTVVGQVGSKGEAGRPYLWLPNRSGQALRLPAPVPQPSRAPTAGAYTIRNGWVTGNVNKTAVRWDLRTGEPRVFPQFLVQASTANRYGWQVGAGPTGRSLLLSDAGPVLLPDLVAHKRGESANLPRTLSDDGRVIGGQADDRGGIIRAVVWTCS
jgi:hypothetical protein